MLKRKGHQLENFRPSPLHWASFAKIVVEKNLFEDFLELAYQQAFWQFVDALTMMKVDDSTQCAKENAVLSLVYINMTRMVLSQMITKTTTNILPLAFLNKLAKIDNDADMEAFVESDFRPLICAPNSAEGVNFPKFTRAFDVTSKIQPFDLVNCFSFFNFLLYLPAILRPYGKKLTF